MSLWVTDFADGSDTSVRFSVSVAVDSLKPGMSCQSFRLEGWRGRATECVFSNGMSTEPALSNPTSGGDMLPEDQTIRVWENKGGGAVCFILFCCEACHLSKEVSHLHRNVSCHQGDV